MAKSLKFKRPKNLEFILIVIILFLCLYIYKQFSPRSFPPDFKELNFIPPDVQKQLGGNAISTSGSFRIPILLYHYVEYVKDRGDRIRISLNIEPDIFDEQVKTLKEGGYTFLWASDVPDILNGSAKLPPKCVILTFDDGYRDFYTDVFPILKKYRAKAVAYIVPGFLDEPNNLTHLQLKEIAESKLVEIAAHTVDHVYLRGLDERKVKFEVEQSKLMLERELHIPIVSFAYPYGAFDVSSIDIVKNAGFKSAVSTVAGIDEGAYNAYFLYRLKPGVMMGKTLLDFLAKSNFSN